MYPYISWNAQRDSACADTFGHVADYSSCYRGLRLFFKIVRFHTDIFIWNLYWNLSNIIVVCTRVGNAQNILNKNVDTLHVYVCTRHVTRSTAFPSSSTFIQKPSTSARERSRGSPGHTEALLEKYQRARRVRAVERSPFGPSRVQLLPAGKSLRFYLSRAYMGR